MRTNAALSIVLLLVSCAGRSSATTSPSPSSTPPPLQSCEVRTIELDGAELVVQANADQTVASIVVVKAPDDASRSHAYDDAVRIFGAPRPDTRTQMRQLKDGLSELTDYCGRPAPRPQQSPG